MSLSYLNDKVEFLFHTGIAVGGKKEFLIDFNVVVIGQPPFGSF
jgi:hypothetical protein